MKTAEEYRKQLHKMNPNIYIGGEQLRRDAPRLQQPIKGQQINAQEAYRLGLINKVVPLD